MLEAQSNSLEAESWVQQPEFEHSVVIPTRLGFAKKVRSVFLMRLKDGFPLGLQAKRGRYFDVCH